MCNAGPDRPVDPTQDPVKAYQDLLASSQPAKPDAATQRAHFLQTRSLSAATGQFACGTFQVPTLNTRAYENFEQLCQLQMRILVDAMACEGDGDQHNLYNVPFVLGGNVGGYFETGRFLRYTNSPPHGGLLVSICNAMGVPTTEFGMHKGGVLPRLTSA